jgi:hypothetical protein
MYLRLAGVFLLAFLFAVYYASCYHTDEYKPYRPKKPKSYISQPYTGIQSEITSSNLTPLESYFLR